MTSIDAESEVGSEGIGLAEMIATLRSELLRAQSDPDANRLPLLTGPVELELTVAITKEVEGGGKIRFWVVDAGASASKSGVETHKFKISLNPVDPKTGKRAKVAGEADQSAPQK